MVYNLGERTCNGVVLVTKGVELVWDKHPPRARVAVNTLLNGFIQNTNPRWVKNVCHVAVPTILYLTLLEEGVITLWNWTICVGHGRSNLLKAPLRYDVIEVDGGC